MRTDPRRDRPPVAPLGAPAQEPSAGPSSASRVGTIVFFLALGLIGWFLVAHAGGGSDEAREGETGSASAPPAAADALTAGTYRLPGLSVPVSVTVPAGWTARDAVWGPAGQGVAAITTGPPGAEISIAVLDLSRLRPVDPATGEARDRAGDAAWFRRSLDDFGALVEPRLRDRVVGRRLDRTPPPALAWLLMFTERGPIGVADDIVYADMPGDLVSFAFPGPRRAIFSSDGGEIELRPGVTYTFWLPRRGPGVPPIALGVARQLGAVPGSAEWDVVRTLELGG